MKVVALGLESRGRAEVGSRAEGLMADRHGSTLEITERGGAASM